MATVPTTVTRGDLERFRAIERSAKERIAAELTEAGLVNANGAPVDAGQVDFVLSEFRRLVMKEAGPRTVVSGRLR
jgi:hypothetical protein